jgi:DNA-binding PadR family transcriptional regulator
LNKDKNPILNLLRLLKRKSKHKYVFWTTLYSTGYFKSKGELNRAIYRAKCGGLIEIKSDVRGHHYFRISEQGKSFLEMFTPKRTVRVLKGGNVGV